MILSFYEKNRKDTRQNTTKVNENQKKKEDLSKTFQQERLLTRIIHGKLQRKGDGAICAAGITKQLGMCKERARKWRLKWDIRKLIRS